MVCNDAVRSACKAGALKPNTMSVAPQHQKAGLQSMAASLQVWTKLNTAQVGN